MELQCRLQPPAALRSDPSQHITPFIFGSSGTRQYLRANQNKMSVLDFSSMDTFRWFFEMRSYRALLIKYFKRKSNLSKEFGISLFFWVWRLCQSKGEKKLFGGLSSKLDRNPVPCGTRPRWQIYCLPGAALQPDGAGRWGLPSREFPCSVHVCNWQRPGSWRGRPMFTVGFCGGKKLLFFSYPSW